MNTTGEYTNGHAFRSEKQVGKKRKMIRGVCSDLADHFSPQVRQNNFSALKYPSFNPKSSWWDHNNFESQTVNINLGNKENAELLNRKADHNFFGMKNQSENDSDEESPKALGTWTFLI